MYSEPRLAEHLDLSSLQSLTETYEAIFKASLWRSFKCSKQQRFFLFKTFLLMFEWKKCMCFEDVWIFEPWFGPFESFRSCEYEEKRWRFSFRYLKQCQLHQACPDGFSVLDLLETEKWQDCLNLNEWKNFEVRLLQTKSSRCDQLEAKT